MAEDECSPGMGARPGHPLPGRAGTQAHKSGSRGEEEA